MIRIDGATFGELIGVTFSASGDNVIRNSTMRLHDGGRHYVTDAADLLVSGNTFFKGGFHVSGEASVTVVNNRFEGTAISLASTGQSQIAGNQFIEPANYRAIEQERGRSTITDNVLTAPSAPQSAWTAIAVNNYRLDPPETVAADILDNTITGFPTGVLLGGTGVLDVRLTENRFSENAKAVVVTKQTRVQMEANDFLRNATAIQLLETSTAEIHGNCIATNTDYGLDSRTSEAADATGNWWGAPSGPRHPSNPGGAGDVVRGDTVDFSGWLQVPNCEGARPTPTATLVKTATQAPTPTRTPTLPSTATPTPTAVDLVADRLEVVQAVQDLHNRVPLVARKRAFVRFHVHASEEGHGASATLRVQGGSGSATVLPLNPGGSIAVRKAPLRSRRDESFLFELPEGFREGTVALTGHLNPINLTQNESNDEVSATVSFQDVPDLYVVIYGIRYTRAGMSYFPAPHHRQRLLEWLGAAYPTATVRRQFRSHPIKFEVDLAACAFVNSALVSIRAWNRLFSGEPAGIRYYGMVDDSGSFMRGCGFQFSGTAVGPTGDPQRWANFAWDTDDSYGDWMGGHELGHTLGGEHPGICGEVGLHPFANPNGKISPTTDERSPAAVFGYDARTGEIYPPDYHDIMTYCADLWPSDAHYRIFLETMRAEGASGAAASPGDVRDRLLVVGSINLDTNETSLQPLFVVPNAADPDPPVPGAHAIVLRDQLGRQLARYPFTAEESHGEVAPEPSEPAPRIAFFDELVPYVAGTTMVDIEGPGGRLARVTAGAHPPAIQITAPNGGEILAGDLVTVDWAAADEDGDPLTFSLQYSNDDGVTWTTVAQDIVESGVDIDAMNLPAGDRARFRVWVSDGIHTSSDETDGVFTVPNRPPAGEIVEPAHDVTVAAGQTVTFVADVYDLDTGTLPDEQLTWQSSIDGPLGDGATLAIASLSVGAHTITLRADDGQGGVATDTVGVAVVAELADLPPVADALRIEPAGILLDPFFGDASDVLSIQNENRGNAIAWRADKSQPWLQLGATTGSTPAEVDVTFAGLSLPPGRYSATITVTSPSLPGAQERISVDVLLRAPPTCLGDCDGGGAVTINELITGVNIALGALELAQCAAFTRNYDGLVTIDELIAAVNNALGRCPGP